MPNACVYSLSLFPQEACDAAAASASEGARITAAAVDTTARMSCAMEGRAASEDALCQGM